MTEENWTVRCVGCGSLVVLDLDDCDCEDDQGQCPKCGTVLYDGMSAAEASRRAPPSASGRKRVKKTP